MLKSWCIIFLKMEDEAAGVAIKEFLGLKLKMYSFLIYDSSEHKKVKSVNKNVIATISRNKYEDVLLNKKCLMHSMNGIQSKDDRIETCEIDKVS